MNSKLDISAGKAAAPNAAAAASTAVAPKGAAGAEGSKSKKDCVTELVGLLEDARKADSNSYDAQIQELRKKKNDQKKENKRLKT